MNAVLTEITLPSGPNLQLVQGDILIEATDAIVNAANQYLQHGGGVEAAISRRSGGDIQRESNEWVATHGPVRHDAPAWTSGGTLPCRYVIHAVGPVWGDARRADAGRDEASPRAHNQADVKLAAAVTGSLRVADELALGSIAFPAIATGIFGFPKERAAGVILSAIREYFAGTKSGLTLVRLILYDAPTLEAFEKVWHDHFRAKL